MIRKFLRLLQHNSLHAFHPMTFSFLIRYSLLILHSLQYHKRIKFLEAKNWVTCSRSFVRWTNRRCTLVVVYSLRHWAWTVIDFVPCNYWIFSTFFFDIIICLCLLSTLNANDFNFSQKLNINDISDNSSNSTNWNKKYFDHKCGFTTKNRLTVTVPIKR